MYISPTVFNFHPPLAGRSHRVLSKPELGILITTSRVIVEAR